MKKNLSVFIFLLLLSPSLSFSQNVLDSLHANFFVNASGIISKDYIITRANLNFGKAKSTEGFDIGTGINFKIGRHFYLRPEFGKLFLFCNREGTDSSYYASAGIVGHSNYHLKQNISHFSLELNFPLNWKKWIYAPGISLGYITRTKINAIDLTTGTKENISFGPDLSIASLSLNIGRMTTKNISLWVGYYFTTMSYSSDYNGISQGTRSSGIWYLDGKMHSLEIRVALNIVQNKKQ